MQIVLLTNDCANGMGSDVLTRVVAKSWNSGWMRCASSSLFLDHISAGRVS